MPYAPPRRLTITGYLTCVAIAAMLIGRTAPGTLAAARTGVATEATDDSDSVSPTAIDPAAVSAVSRMSAYLNSLVHYTVHVESTTDQVRLVGPAVQMSAVAEVSVRRPNALRVVVRGDDVDQQLVYDGATIALSAARANVYAVDRAPATLDTFMDVLERDYGLSLPVSDLLYRARLRPLLRFVTAGVVVGRSWVGDAECDHLAFHQRDIDWQLWIQRGDRPLPRKLVVTTLGEDGAPQHTAVMTWNVEPREDDGVFEFVAPPGAERRTVAAVNHASTHPFR